MQKNFILGDEWLYYKIYTGAKTADNILIDVIKPIAQTLFDEQVIDKWFFIRYSDPDFHIRVRFHCVDISKIGIVNGIEVTSKSTLSSPPIEYSLHTVFIAVPLPQFSRKTFA